MRFPGLLVAGLLCVAVQASAQSNENALRLNDPTFASQYVSVTDKVGLQGNSQYTIEAWVFPTSISGFPTIVGNDYSTSFWLGLNGSGALRFYPRGGTPFDGVAVLPLNRWTHVAVTYDAVAGSRMYVNGVLDRVNTAIVGAPGTNAGDLRIGADRQGGIPSYFWSGGIDEVRIWSVVRSQAQILANRSIAIGGPGFAATPTYSGLQANWIGDAPTGTLFDCATAGAHHAGTFVNEGAGVLSPYLGTPISLNTAIELNGIDDYVRTPDVRAYGDGLTIDAWIAPYACPTYATIVGRNFSQSFWLGITFDQRLRFYPRGPGGYVETDPGVIQFGHWQHVAATYDGAVTRLYVNGKRLLTSSAISGPIGTDGTTSAWVGADNEGGPNYFFEGALDEVRLLDAVATDAQVADRMWFGYGVGTASDIFFNGTYRTAICAALDANDFSSEVHGSTAHFVRSGATFLNNQPYFANYASMVPGGELTLPEDTLATGVIEFVDIPFDQPVNNVRAFVMAPVQDLSLLDVMLKSPTGTVVHLLRRGDAVGSNLSTWFDDGSSNLLAEPRAPFQYGVRPAEPLSTFNGERSRGEWMIDMRGYSALPITRLGLWAWGVQVNNMPLAVGDSPVPARIALVNRGTNPSRGSGAFDFTLPRDADAELSLFDVQGRSVGDLFRARASAGVTHVRWTDRDLASGVYLARLRVDGRESATARVVIQR